MADRVFQFILDHKSQATHVNGRPVRGADFPKRLVLHSFLTFVLTLVKSLIFATFRVGLHPIPLPC